MSQPSAREIDVLEVARRIVDGAEIVEPKITEAQAKICREKGISEEDFLAILRAFSPVVSRK